MDHVAHAFDTPLGRMLAVADGDGALLVLEFLGDRDAGGRAAELGAGLTPSCRSFGHAAEAVGRWFEGEHAALDAFPLHPEGTSFQRRVWDEVRRVPWGATASYGEIAARLRAPGASRAVGRANAANPICLAIPCHRIVGASGALTGYGGGLERKRALLELESAQQTLPLP